jgi:hypothetical protein
MTISPKSIPPIARFITGDIDQTPYLTGLELVELFNAHGSDDVYEYGKGTFPSRWMYVEQKLEIINNSDHLIGVLEELIDDRFYLDKEEDLETAVKYLNDIIKYDGYQVEKVGLIKKVVPIDSFGIKEDKKERKPNNQGGRPQGLTKRTVERYKKVFLKYEALRSKNTSKTKAELYELLAAIDYDGKTFTRRTIRNIIEDKKYNLISTR